MHSRVPLTDGATRPGSPGRVRDRLAGMGRVVVFAMLAVATSFATGQFPLSTAGEDLGAVNRTRTEAAYVLPVASMLTDPPEPIREEESIGTAVTPSLPEQSSAVVPAGDALGDPVLWQFRIPTVGVAAPMIPLGIDSTGVMQVPHDAITVGWYRFSATPGDSGNAVVAAHVDYRGKPAVFSQIGSLSPGDHVVLHAGGSAFTYAVDSVRLVRPETADVGQIVGTREGPPTMTLITCGGSWDRERADYDHRVIVTASLIRSELPS